MCLNKYLCLINTKNEDILNSKTKLTKQLGESDVWENFL